MKKAAVILVILFSMLFAFRGKLHTRSEKAKTYRPTENDSRWYDFLGAKEPHSPVVVIPSEMVQRPEKSETVGGPGGGVFEVQMEGNLLIGLNVWLGDYSGHKVIRGIQPLFLTRDGIRLGAVNGNSGHTGGKPIGTKAKDGYAVGGLIAKGGDLVDGFKVLYMKRTLVGLDTTDSYEGEWIGGTGGSAERRLGGTGDPVIGISGRAGSRINRLSLLLKANATTIALNLVPPKNPIPKPILTPAVPATPPPAIATPAKATVNPILTPVVPTTPAPAVVPTEELAATRQEARVAKTLALSANWDTSLQGGSKTIDDLSKLFGGVATAKANLSGDESIRVYQDIPYLTPIRQVIETLKLSHKIPSKVLVACPGLPKDSFFYYALDGRFDGSFTRIYLVVDRADQFVCAQLVNEAPRGEVSVSNRDAGWHTYNFINTRTKALSTVRIEHKVILGDGGEWNSNIRAGNVAPVINAKNAGWTVLRLDSTLVRLDDGKFSHARVLEEVRWYAPRPLIELILSCVQKSPR